MGRQNSCQEVETLASWLDLRVKARPGVLVETGSLGSARFDQVLQMFFQHDGTAKPVRNRDETRKRGRGSVRISERGGGNSSPRQVRMSRKRRRWRTWGGRESSKDSWGVSKESRKLLIVIQKRDVCNQIKKRAGSAKYRFSDSKVGLGTDGNWCLKSDTSLPFSNWSHKMIRRRCPKSLTILKRYNTTFFFFLMMIGTQR